MAVKKALGKGLGEIMEEAAKEGTKKAIQGPARSGTLKVLEGAAKKSKDYIGKSVMDGGLAKHLNLSNIGATGATNYLAHIPGASTSAAGAAVRQSGIGSSMKSAVKSMGKNLSDAGWDMAKSDMMRRGVKYGAAGAAIGGTVSAVQGEDFWDGAGRGMVGGGIAGAGVSVGRAALGAHSGQSMVGAGKSLVNQSGISKSVTALSKMADSARNSPTRMRR